MFSLYLTSKSLPSVHLSDTSSPAEALATAESAQLAAVKAGVVGKVSIRGGGEEIAYFTVSK
jgi:hypothetical protein